jgi:pantoate--beta-alanine ligase
MVINKLLGFLNYGTILVTCPTLREHDGLAMSSRNMRLNAQQREQAPLIFKVLSEIKKSLVPGKVDHLKKQAADMLTDGGFRVEYVEIADASSLQPCNEWDGRAQLVALAAAFLGEVRLIDNMLLGH